MRLSARPSVNVIPASTNGLQIRNDTDIGPSGGSVLRLPVGQGHRRVFTGNTTLSKRVFSLSAMVALAGTMPNMNGTGAATHKLAGGH